MKKTSLAVMTATLCFSGSLFAQTEATQKTAPAYGDNPNLISVLATKAQEKVQNAAEKVGAVAERGVAKIKPSVDNTWQNTKDYTTEQATLARDNTRQGIDQAVQKVKQTKENLTGAGGVPIERGSLSQSTPLSSTQSYNQATTQSVQIPQDNPVDAQIQQPTQSVQSIDLSPAPPSSTSDHPPEFSESEIKRQSIPIQTSSAQAPVNVETPSEAPLAVPQKAQDDDQNGVPR